MSDGTSKSTLTSGSKSSAAAIETTSEPNVLNDPRFRAGRKLVQSGNSGENAIEIFAILVEESRLKYGLDGIETSACYYEYGNALFRTAVAAAGADADATDDDAAAAAAAADDDEEKESFSDSNVIDMDNKKKEEKLESKGKLRSAIAEAAEKRLEAAQPGSNNSNYVDRKTDSTLSDDYNAISSGKTASKSEENVEKPKAVDSSKSGESKATISKTPTSLTTIRPPIHPPMNDDISLALEMMENAFSIMDQYINTPTMTSNTNTNIKNASYKTYQSWCQFQIPRVLCGIGDVHSFLKRHADAADAYIRAIPYRETLLQEYTLDDSNTSLLSTTSTSTSTSTAIAIATAKMTSNQMKKPESLSLDYLKARRLFVEVHVLAAEELLAHPPNIDVIATPAPILTSATSTTTKNKQKGDELQPILLVKSSERIEFATGYYEKARDELQETVFLMGKIAASGIDLGTEKEDVCFLATILMGVGNTLADLDEMEEQEKMKAEKESPNKKAKTY